MNQNRRNQKQKSGNKVIKAFLIIVFLIIIIGAGISFYAFNIYQDSTTNPFTQKAESYELVIEEGQSFLGVISMLEANGVIKNALALQIYTRLEAINPQVKFGTYALSENLTLNEFISLIETGSFEEGVTITFKEGLRYEQIADLLAEQPSLTSFDKQLFLNIAENPDSYSFSPTIQTFLDEQKPAGKSLRGFLYPDTYQFDKDSTAQIVAEKMLENFIIRVTANLDLNNLNLETESITTLYEALTLASIIEKEASAWDDRSEIASVFHNRLVSGITLDSDATVNFITGKNDAGVSFADRDIIDPYNTYQFQGLPPTPIVNPRVDSIVAAFYPKVTPYFFFYHTPDGQTFFNETLQGHTNGVCRDLGCNF